MEPKLKQRKIYFVCTSIFFIIGFILYGVLGTKMKNMLNNFPFENSLVLFLLFGMLGAWLLFGLSSGILFFAGFICKKELSVKILAAVFFPITFIFIIYGGIFGCLPYGIYNVIQLYKLSRLKPKKRLERKN